jgi:hypothetical protein
MRGNETGGRLSAADVEARGFGAARFGLDGVWQSGYEFTNANIWIASEFSPIARHSHEARARSFALCLLHSRLPFVTR